MKERYKKAGDPTGETGPTPELLMLIDYGKEEFWEASKWPLWQVKMFLDNEMDVPCLFNPEQFANLIKTDPVTAFQSWLDDLHLHYNRWSSQKEHKDTLEEFRRIGRELLKHLEEQQRDN